MTTADVDNFNLAGLLCCRNATGNRRFCLPLKSVAVHAEVRGWAVAVTAELHYHNHLNEPTECQFVFPLSDRAAVYRLEADLAGRKLKAECRPRQEAYETYRDAVQSGRTAVLLENQKDVEDIFRIMLGNLPPNAEAKMTVGYVQPADRDVDGDLTFTLPVVLNPRYVPAHVNLARSSSSQPYTAVSQLLYSMTFDAEINLGTIGKIADVKPANKSDSISWKFENDDMSRASVVLDGSLFAKDHDFGLCIQLAEPWKPTMFVEPGQSSGSKNWLSFDMACAWFEPPEITCFMDEYWFLIDRSSKNSSIERAKTALSIFIKNLPKVCKFNVIGFGSDVVNSLFQGRAVRSSKSTVDFALQNVAEMRANLGETAHVSSALRCAYSMTKPQHSYTSRQFVVVIINSDVEEAVITHAEAIENTATMTVFVLEIGAGEELGSTRLRRLAKASGGCSVILRDDDTDLEMNHQVKWILTAARNLIKSTSNADEYWFVVDRSGSMSGGSKINNAASALILFVKSLPNDCRFNIIGFGSNFVPLFPWGPANYTTTTVSEALSYADNISADMGGTEILRPLEHIYAQPMSSATVTKRFIFLLTDGEVANTGEVINLAAKNASTTRVFTVGIGEGASTALVNGLARVSGGLSAFVRNSNDKLQTKVIRLLKFATKCPLVENLALTWDIIDDRGKLCCRLPEDLPTVTYQGHPIIQYALLDERPVFQDVTGSATLDACIAGSPVNYKLNFTFTASKYSNSDDPMPLHRLAAKARLIELAAEMMTRGYDTVKQELVAISLATGVLCNETAFVAVDQDTGQWVKGGDIESVHYNVPPQTGFNFTNIGTNFNVARIGQPWATFAQLGPPPSGCKLFGAKVSSVDQGGLFSFASTGSAPQQISFGAKSESATFGSSSIPFSCNPSEYQTLTAYSFVIVPDDLATLVRQQNVDGSWNNFDAKYYASLLQQSVNDPCQVITTAISKSTGKVVDGMAMAATLIGLALLRHKFTNRYDEWQLIEQKTINFLLKSGFFQSQEQIDEIIEADVRKALGI